MSFSGFSFGTPEPTSLEPSAVATAINKETGGLHWNAALAMLLRDAPLAASEAVVTAMRGLPLGTAEHFKAVVAAMRALQQAEPGNERILAVAVVWMVLGGDPGESEFKPLRRWPAELGPLIAAGFIGELCGKHGELLEQAFLRLEDGGRCLLIGLRAPNLWEESTRASAAAKQAAKDFLHEQSKALGACEGFGWLPQSAKRKRAPSPELVPDIGLSAEAVEGLLTELDKSLREHARCSNRCFAIEFAEKATAALDAAIAGKVAGPVLLARLGRVDSLDQDFRQRLEYRIQEKITPAAASADARQATDMFAAGAQLPKPAMSAKEVSAAALLVTQMGGAGGKGDFAGIASKGALRTDSASALPALAAASNPTCPMPDVYVPADGLLRPAYFVRQRSLVDTLLKDNEHEVTMVQSEGGAFGFKRRSSQPEYRQCETPLDMMRGGAALGVHCVQFRQWDQAMVQAHYQFLTTIVDLHTKSKHSWVQVCRLEDDYRKRVHAGLQTAWDDDQALSCLMTLSFKAGSGALQAPTVGLDKPNFCHGVTVCKNWNASRPCTREPCRYKHVCARCHGSHKDVAKDAAGKLVCKKAGA